MPKNNRKSTQKRTAKCQDVKCLVLFILSGALMLVLSYFSLTTGNIYELVYGRDYLGNLCNANAPMLVYYNYSDAFSYRKCVSTCPDPKVEPVWCQYKITPQGNVYEQIRKGDCIPTIKTAPIFNRCVPSDLLADLKNSGSNDTIASWADTLNSQLLNTDSRATWQQVSNNVDVIIYSCLIAFAGSILWYFLMQTFVKFMIYFTTIFAVALSGATIGIFTYLYLSNKATGDSLEKIGFSIPDSLRAYYNGVLLALIVISAIVTLGLIIAIIMYRKKIDTAIEALHEIVDVLQANRTLVLFPLFNSVVILILGAFLILLLSYLAVNGVEKTSNWKIRAGPTTLLVTGKTFVPTTALTPYIIPMEVYAILWFAWCASFNIALQQGAISGAIEKWYFRANKNKVLKTAVFNSYLELLRYSIGSIALGCVLRPIVFIWNWIYFVISPSISKAQKAEGVNTKNTAIDRFYKKVGDIMRTTGRNAYIELPLYGSTHSYLECAKLADDLLSADLKNLKGFQSVPKFVFALGQLVIVIGTTIFGAAAGFSVRAQENAFSNNAILVLIIFIAAVVISVAFLGTYVIAIDALFLCYCEDITRNTGGADSKYHFSNRIRQLMDIEVEILDLSAAERFLE